MATNHVHPDPTEPAAPGVDDTGGWTARCRAAGMAYLQHIVATHHPLTTPTASPTTGTTSDPARHRRTHTDLLIFTTA